MSRRYSQRFDAIYDDVELIWLESTCTDPSCDYCADRPERPVLDIQDEILNDKRFVKETKTSD